MPTACRLTRVTQNHTFFDTLQPDAHLPAVAFVRGRLWAGAFAGRGGKQYAWADAPCVAWAQRACITASKWPSCPAAAHGCALELALLELASDPAMCTASGGAAGFAAAWQTVGKQGDTTVIHCCWASRGSGGSAMIPCREGLSRR